MTLFVIATFAIPLALAEDNESDTNDDSSDAISLYNDTSNIPEGMVISPGPNNSDEIEDNETASGMDVFKARMGIWFTFNQEKKAEKELGLADLRLIQARIAARNNDTAAMEKALEAHERIMDRVQIRIGELNLSADKLVGLNRAIEVHTAQLGKLQNLLANANLTDAQRTRIEARITHTNNVTANLMAIQERARERIMSNGGNDDSEDNETEEESEDETEDDSNDDSGNGNGNDDSSDNETEDDSEDDDSENS